MRTEILTILAGIGLIRSKVSEKLILATGRRGQTRDSHNLSMATFCLRFWKCKILENVVQQLSMLRILLLVTSSYDELIDHNMHDLRINR